MQRLCVNQTGKEIAYRSSAAVVVSLQADRSTGEVGQWDDQHVMRTPNLNCQQTVAMASEWKVKTRMLMETVQAGMGA